MDNKRTYLDSLNTGRMRRPQTTLEQLNRSLEHLEHQLDQRHAPRSAAETYQNSRRKLADETAYYPAIDEEALAAPRPTPRSRLAAEDLRRPEPAYARSHPDQSRIADELEALRAEMRAQLSRDAAQPQAARIVQELEAMRKEMREQLDGARKDLAARMIVPGTSVSQINEAAEIKAEIERLTDAVQSMTHRNDERPLNVLRLELEQARAAIDSLAREDTVRSIGSRWDDFERRMSSFQENMTADIRNRPHDSGFRRPE